MNSLTLDHIILVVSDLQVASRQFSQLGFSVIAGGVHSGGLTQNALVPFPDGTYLELLATTRSSTLRKLSLLKRLRLLGIYTSNETAIGRRLIYDLASGVGMNDYALLSSDLQHQVNSVKERGISFTDPIPGGRLRPDGKEISWRTSVPNSIDLPFLIDDLTPRETRAPVVEENYHSNGILGINGLTILVSNLVESMAHYRSLLGDDPITQPHYPQPGTQSSEFTLDTRFLSIVTPLPGNSALRSLLKRRAARPLGIFFRTIENGQGELLSLTYLPEKGATLARSRVLLS
jgi:hypothetical protein